MKLFSRFRELRPHPLRSWRRGFIATTVLAAFLFVAIRLWNAGSAEWAFVLAFVAAWLLMTALWSNDDFIEQSSQILANCVDENFENISERLQKIEVELDQNRNQPGRRFSEGSK